MERNSFLGIDLMFARGKFFCLEANPGPGWSTFNHPSKSEFARAIFDTFKFKENFS
jgi:D-alanine-D-alanine ligase-like ATP-grasp enzyme